MRLRILAIGVAGVIGSACSRDTDAGSSDAGSYDGGSLDAGSSDGGLSDGGATDPTFGRADFNPASYPAFDGTTNSTGACASSSISGVVECANVVYSIVDGTTLTMDIYLPQSALTAPVPALVYYHSGGWFGGNKEEAEPSAVTAPTPFAENLDTLSLPTNYAIITVEYRLTAAYPLHGLPTAIAFPANIQDAKTAVQWIRAKASKYVDTNNIVAWGFSAGGHLAMMMGTTENVAAFAGRGPSDVSVAVNGVVAVSPPVDMSVFSLANYTAYLNDSAEVNPTSCAGDLLKAEMALQTSSNPPTNAAALLNVTSDNFETVPADVPIALAASPIDYVSTSSAPMTVFTGTCDTTVPYIGMDNFAAAAMAAGATFSRTIVPNAGHGSAADTPDADSIIGAFLTSVMK